MRSHSFFTAEQGDNPLMPDNKKLKNQNAGEGKSSESSGGSGASPEMAFDPIEAALRQLHESMASEEIPDDFLRLLDQLDERSAPE